MNCVVIIIRTNHSAFAENVPRIKYSDPGNQSGILFPLITNDPVGAILTPFPASEAPSGGDAFSIATFFDVSRSKSLEFHAIQLLQHPRVFRSHRLQPLGIVPHARREEDARAREHLRIALPRPTGTVQPVL